MATEAHPLDPAVEGVPMFEEERRGPLKRLQHFLHAYPTTVPFIVLLLGVALFSAVVGAGSSTHSTCP